MTQPEARSAEAAVDGAADWSWLDRRGDVVFIPPVPAEVLPAAVAAAEDPTQGMARSEKAVLSLLRLWPAGATAGALARQLEISESSARRGLRAAQARGCAVAARTVVPWYRGHRRVVLWRLRGGAAVAGLLPYLPLPAHARRPVGQCRSVPPQFWRLFWSGTDPAEAQLPRDFLMVGGRLLGSFDPAAQGWVLSRFTDEQLVGCLGLYPDPESEIPSLIRRELASRGATGFDREPLDRGVASPDRQPAGRRGEMRVVAEGMTVDGLRVGSVPDLMAMKLDALLNRSEPKDYIDIAEMDRSGACRLEDGLVFHAERYGTSVAWTETHLIADSVTRPPALRPDPAFNAMAAEAVAHLESRRPEVMQWAAQMREQAF